MAGPTPDPARLAAVDVLTAVRADDAYPNLLLPHVLRRHGLRGRDAAFATELVGGTLRRQGTYDAVLADCVDRPLRKVQVKVLDVLRLGTHQLLGMRVPAHAAIATSVDLARARVGHRAGGFVNAVLRTVATRDLEGWVDHLAVADDPVGRAVLAHAHPRWIVELLSEALAAGGAEHELAALLAADNTPARVTLAARPGAVTVDELVAAGGTASATSPYAVELDGGDPADVAAVAEGRAGVQDEGSQLVALTLAGSAPVRAGERWLDLCAGPGGKAALLAGLAGESGARLLAAERQAHRARLVAATAGTVAGGMLGVVTADGTRPPWPPGTFDRVLVDAPCTGLGALRRRPEARWRRQPGDLADLVPLQGALLASALDSVRPGGTVLYATCSPVLAETAGVVDAVLADRPEVGLGDAHAAVTAVPGVRLSPEACRGPLPGTVQLWPHRHGTDAMFMALLQRS